MALQVCDYCSACGSLVAAATDPSVVLRLPGGGGVSLAERGPLWCPATPRDGVIPRRVVQMGGTVGILPYCTTGHDVGGEETIK